MNKIPIFLSTDDNYAPFASIMMKSVLQHIGVNGVHYSNTSSDHALNKKNYSMTSIHHPQFIHFNQKLIDRIYREKFRISYQNKKEIKIYLFGFIPLFKIEGN